MRKREIKFRAWDKENKTMFCLDDFTDLGNELLKQIDKTGEYDLEKDFIWMQYTGLKDKNGKEIYRGDIMFNSNDKNNYEMIWNDSDACFMLGENGGRLSKYALSAFWKVIGNIYENPKLLNN